jgi:hypothetical protein
MRSATAANAIPASISPAPKGSGEASAVRFTLRKRSARSNESETMTLSSYNSAFLSGLFADVAKANVLSEFQISQATAPVTSEAASNVIEEVRPSKRSRLSLSSCRSRASCMNLSLLSSGLQSPKGINEIVSFQENEDDFQESTSPSLCLVVSPPPSKTQPSPSDGNLHRQNSLAFQLSLLESNNGTTKVATSRGDADSKDVAVLAFPNLPATVSDSSCYTGLTRENLARHVPVSEIAGRSLSNGPDKESSFGWFVDLDDQHDDRLPSSGSLLPAVSTVDLAFQAPTAPKRSSDTSEIEWAQAADTVDSVLGDLF